MNKNHCNKFILRTALKPPPKGKLKCAEAIKQLKSTIHFGKSFLYTYEKIKNSDLFDSDFYKRTYADILDPGEDPIIHFLLYGTTHGFLPSRNFDPVAYKLRYSGIIANNENSLVHFLLVGKEEGREIPAGFASFFPKLSHINRSVGEITDEFDTYKDIKLSRKRTSLLAQPSVTSIDFDGVRYKVRYPRPVFILNLIRKNRAFAFSRRAHGFLDQIVGVVKLCRQIVGDSISKGLTGEEILSIAFRIAYKQYSRSASAKAIYEENFIREILYDMITKRRIPSVLDSLAFTGYPTWDKRLFAGPRIHEEDYLDKMDILTQLFDPDDLIFDARVLKGGVISGVFKELPEICRGHPVVMIGPPWLNDLGKRWNLHKYHHIKIPHLNTMVIRNEILRNICEFIENDLDLYRNNQGSLPRPIFFFQSGSSLASWFIYRLVEKYPEFIYINMGMAINAWYLDEPFCRGHGWVKTYFMPMMNNLCLERHYRMLAGANFDKWFEEYEEMAKVWTGRSASKP